MVDSFGENLKSGKFFKYLYSNDTINNRKTKSAALQEVFNRIFLKKRFK